MPNPNILFRNEPGPSLSENFESALGTQQKLNEYLNQPLKNRLLENEVQASDMGLQQAQRQAGLQEQDQQRKAYLQQIGDMAFDAIELTPLVQAGDVGQITTALDRRIEKIRARGGDPSDTIDFRQRLLSGQITKEQAVQELNSVVSAAERIGVIKPGQATSQGQEPMTEYQRKSLEIREKELNQPTANERNLIRYKDLKKTDPEDAKMFGVEVGLLPPNKNLSATAEKTLTNSTQKYYDLSKQVREYELLAGDFERYAKELPSGSAATISEFLKSVTGSQDDATELRRRLAKVRLSEALKYLPPGPATDRDVEVAFEGVPKGNASVEQVQMFLRGSAKMAAIDADFEEFKSNYISQFNSVEGLIPAWKAEIAAGRVKSINDLKPMEKETETVPPTATTEVKFLGFE